MEKALRRPMGAQSDTRTVVMPTVWAGQVISSIGMLLVFVLPDAKALWLSVWAAFPLRVAAAETSLRYWDDALYIMCCTFSNRYIQMYFPVPKSFRNLVVTSGKIPNL